jgi:hypothetical protein
VVVLVELCIVASDERTGGFVCRCCEGRSEEDEGGGEDGGGLHGCVAVVVMVSIAVVRVLI